ncbi:DNA-3-methyladenine glycosylase 2 family protein [Vibrio sp. SS-MA-C1-2]|uniref:DNA-3-methyladenine glycosylase family protein n=1 Tax=Vibrio sp. SS-MA-C1-2 TaxID=2908646 RepID=UPI001F48602B|nr:DNA-3-methyladenine glycosylase 2 family protein [Vibrio sp. SS-MA-C1-2]UJF20049.1 DNA-3-methyladenine glycosylase 2 family protein [Vibrio sp. SS-MA-C1-2]
MKNFQLTQQKIKADLQQLALIDPKLQQWIEEYGFPQYKARDHSFEAFANVILGQQLSVKAAHTIRLRTQTLLPEFTPDAFLNISDDELRAVGWSRRKIDYAKGLSEAMVTGSFELSVLEQLSDQEAISYIIQLKGFGVWSAQIYLLFSLGRLDILPAGDLVIRKAISNLYELEEVVDEEETIRLGENYQHYRSALAIMLWHRFNLSPFK